MARRQKTLLCVDDNQSSLKIWKIILEDSGYKVLTASSGREGLEVFCVECDRCGDSRLSNAGDERRTGCGRNETDESGNSHSHAFWLGVIARKRASTS